MRAGYKEVAEFALTLAPNDPQTHYTLAVFDEKVFSPENLQKSLAEYEQSAALSPNDYRVWLGLGNARERSGDAAGAELALRKSLELAPNYAPVHWTSRKYSFAAGQNRRSICRNPQSGGKRYEIRRTDGCHRRTDF